MDRNQATGLILFAAVILIYSIFFASGPELSPVETTVETEAVNSASPESTIETVALPDSLIDAKRAEKYGVFAALTVGEEEEITLENDDVKITLSTKGGQISQVELKQYKSWKNEPLYLLDEQSSSMSFELASRLGPLNLADLYFKPTFSEESGENGTVKVLTLTATSDYGKITQTYRLAKGSYLVSKSLDLGNFQNQLSGKEIQFSWNDQIKAQEKDLAESRRKTELNYFTTTETKDNLGVGNDPEESSISEPVKWIGFSQRFFTAGIIADSAFQNVKLAQSTPEDSSVVRVMNAQFSIPMENGKASLSYYFGPDQYKTLKQITPGFEKNVDMGYFFVSWVNKYIVVHLFEFLEKYFNSYGIIIILIVLIIKLALSPLTYKSYIGMAKMRVIKPEIDELKEKYGEDPTKMQQEQMKLFSQLGVSPVAGCLPLLLQMPFLFAMFFFFPNSIELRQESFLWANDLSTYDEFIKLPFTIPFYGSHVSLFTLLMTVSQLIYTHFNNQLTTATGPMKNLGYIMPVMFMFILNSYPAGLSFYYFVSNMFTFGQQALIKLFVDDAKIRQKVEETKAKNVNKKKSKFQQKLEDAMKAADANRKK